MRRGMRREDVERAAKHAALVAALVTVGVSVNGVIQGVEKHAGIAWRWLATVAALCFAGVLAVFFLWNLWTIARARPVNEILETEAAESALLKEPLYAFVAMEFYALMLNRTFAVFVAPDGLYGWKATGIVSHADRKYYEPLRALVTDPELARDMRAIRKLAEQRGGFFYPRAEIAAVSADEKSQWGMGGILTLGHVTVRLASGKRRRLILLGETIPDEARDRIAATLGVPLPSTE